jgi:hypothetical protein
MTLAPGASVLHAEQKQSLSGGAEHPTDIRFVGLRKSCRKPLCALTWS